MVNIVVFFTVPYALVFLYGLRIRSFSSNELLFHMFFVFIVFIVYIAIGYLTCGKIVVTQAFKYPPTAYYLSYAILVSILLYYIITFHDLRVQNLKVV